MFFVIELKEDNIFASMKRLEDLGDSSFILDLRDNLGGLVQVCLISYILHLSMYIYIYISKLDTFIISSIAEGLIHDA